MCLLIQLSTNNHNNTDNPPEEEIIDKLPSIKTGGLETNETESQGAQSNTDSIKVELEEDIKEEINTGLEE
jgi:hypothetical protein